jgi:hypothetical protein
LLISKIVFSTGIYIRTPLQPRWTGARELLTGLGNLLGSTMDGLRENQFETARTTNVGQAFHVDFGSGSVELKEFAKTLKIGDRFRVLSDDGVLLAEKVSQTQFKLLINRDPLQLR